MAVPIHQEQLDGILCVAQAPTLGAQWVPLVAGDGSGGVIRVDPQGNVSVAPAGSTGPYVQFCVSADGAKASILPDRADGHPKGGARWFTYALVVVPVSGF